MPLSEFDIEAAKVYAGKKWQSRRRSELWVQQDGLCHWCKRMTRMPWDQGYLRSTGALSGLAATLDHVNGKLSGRRSKSCDPGGLVMACSTCNGNRAHEECIEANRKTSK